TPTSLAGRLAKDAFLTALVVFLLASQLIGIETIDDPKGLRYITRYDDVIGAVLIVVAGRIGLHLLRVRIALPVLFGAGLFAAAELASLLFGGAGSDWQPRVLPFNSDVVRWTFALCGVVLAIRAAVMLSARHRPPGAPSLMQRAAKDAHRFIPVLG